MITNPFTRMVLFGVPEEIYLGTNGALIRNKDRVTNANEEGCNQYTGPNCGGRISSIGSSPTNRKTRVKDLYEEAVSLALIDSNNDILSREDYPSEETATEAGLRLAKFHKLGVDKKRFTKSGYFKDRRGVILTRNPYPIPLGQEEEGEDYPARTHLDRGHLDRMLAKIRSKRGA